MNPVSRRAVLEEVPDRLLVERVLRDQSESDFLLLYQRHAPLLYRLALRASGQCADADDLVQECWSRALSALAAFEWRSSLRTWLTGILVNLIREAYARRGRRFEIAIPDDWPVPVVESHAVDLERAVALLPTGARLVFLLHDVEGFTHDEIAKELGCTPGTSKTQLHRARRALRRSLSLSDAEES